MNIVPIIADGSILKSHTEYPITNKQWKLMDKGGVTLLHYLDTLQVEDSLNSTRQFAGIKEFYLRERYPNWIDYNLDPWNRKFVVMPLDKKTYTSMYQYYSYGSFNLNLNVDVLVTTVSRSRVFCVDVTKDTV